MSPAPLLKPLPSPLEIARATRAAIARAGPTLWAITLLSSGVQKLLERFALNPLVLDSRHSSSQFLLLGFATVTYLGVGAMAWAAMLWCVDHAEQEGFAPSWAEAIDAVAPRVLSIFIVTVVVGLLVGTGLVFFVVPGLAILVETFACVSFAVTRDAGIFDSFRFTQVILRGVRIPLFRALLVVDLVWLAVQFGPVSPSGSLLHWLRDFGHLQLPGAVVFVVDTALLAALSVWAAAGTQVLFRALLDARGLLYEEDEAPELAEGDEPAGDWIAETERPM